MPMKSRARQSSGERCAFFSEKISGYLRRLIAAEIIRCTGRFIEHDVDRRSRWAVRQSGGHYQRNKPKKKKKKKIGSESSRCRL